MKTVLISIGLLLPVMLWASSEALEKTLLRDVEKWVQNSNYELVLVETPEAGTQGGKYYKVNLSGQVKGFLYTGRVNTVRSASARSGQNASSEYFDYYILYDSDLTVQKVKVLRYKATHGQMISAPSWLKQFQGYKPGQPLEPGRQVDGISGATISVNNITFDIRKNTSILRNLVRKTNP
mgnify:CR=1 FL=1